MMFRRLILVTASFVLTLSLIACNSKVSKLASDDGVVMDLSTVVFADVSERVLKTSCLSCHSKTFPHMETYQEVKAALSQIDRAVFGSRSMPKNGVLSNRQYDILRKWIDLGAPETAAPAATTPVVSVPPLAEATTWKSMREKFVEISCASCHFKGNTEGRIDLTDPKVFKGSIGTILYLSLIEKENPMPPIDKTQLSDVQKRTLTEWIISGQPEE